MDARNQIVSADTGGFGKAAFVNVKRQPPPSAEDALSRWHYPRHLRAAGWHGSACCPGAEAQGEPDSIPRRVRIEWQASRSLITPAKRGQGTRKTDHCTPAKRHAAMIWAQRLKRVFNIDITTCEECVGTVKVIDSIEGLARIKQILVHLQRKAEAKEFNPLPESGTPAQIGLFG